MCRGSVSLHAQMDEFIASSRLLDTLGANPSGHRLVPAPDKRKPLTRDRQERSSAGTDRRWWAPLDPKIRAAATG